MYIERDINRHLARDECLVEQREQRLWIIHRGGEHPAQHGRVHLHLLEAVAREGREADLEKKEQGTFKGLRGERKLRGGSRKEQGTGGAGDRQGPAPPPSGSGLERGFRLVGGERGIRSGSKKKPRIRDVVKGVHRPLRAWD